MNMKKHLCVISCVVLLFITPGTAFAATISLRATPTNVGVGDIVRVDVILESMVPSNAFSGAVSYQKTMLEPIAVSDGNSIVNLWIVHPTASENGSPISFAGVTPGGFSGDNGLLFSILFRAKVAGTANVSLVDIEILRNDGAGGEEPTTTKQLSLSISQKPSGGYKELDDTVPPEPFTASLGDDSQLFGGRSYLAFMAADKGSGIERYAVAESRLPSFLFSLFPLLWNDATSPYVLLDQYRTSTVYIKAVDRAGNERVSTYPPQRLFNVYEAILLGILIGVVLLSRRRWGRRSVQNQ